MAYTLLFSLQNAVCFIILTCLVPVLFTFYIKGVLKLKKNNSGAKRLKPEGSEVDHLSYPNSEVKNEWRYTLATPHYLMT